MAITSAILLMAVMSQAAVTTAPQNDSSSKMGALLSTQGTLIESRIWDVGEVQEPNRGALAIKAINAWAVGKEQFVFRGARITVQRGVQNVNEALIDADEIDGLLRSLDHMKKAMGEATASSADLSKPRLPVEREVVFGTRDGFRLAVNTGVEGFQITCAITRKVPSVVVLFTSARLDEIRALVESARLAGQAK